MDFLSSCAARNLSRHSVAVYRIAIERFIKTAGCLQPSEIDERLLRQYIFHLRASGLSPASVNHYFRIVKIFFRHLYTAGMIPQNPAAEMPTPKKPKRRKRAISEKQAQALLDICPDYTWMGLRDKVAIFLILGSGLRRAELLGLDVGDVILEKCEVYVTGKGSKERIASIDDNVPQALKAWLGVRERVLADRPQDALFLNRNRRRMGDYFGIVVKRHARDCGFFCTPHMLRHTYATEWIRRGGDLQRLKEQLGHSDISITEEYVHLAREDFKRAADSYSITNSLRFDGRQMAFSEM